jgi:NAD(P)-dependent dehydrogenase (short-subunit alcohol dehydrogenase family)
MDLGLKGKVALVTGAARDVGREIALALAAEGASVAVNYNTSADAAASVVEEIGARGGQARAYQADVGDYGSVTAMVGKVAADFGGIDILVNNAGLVLPKPFLETTPDEWKRQIDVGLYGVIHCCHAVGPIMVARGGGRIVNLTGDSARVGEKRLAITAASRGGVLALTKSLARELGRDGITVNAFALGLIETAHSDKAWLDRNRDRIVRQYPLGRIGTAEDVAPMIAFIASEGAGWITGQVVSINGGYSMVG